MEGEREVGEILKPSMDLYLSSAPFAFRVHVVISLSYGQLYFRVVWGMRLSRLLKRSFSACLAAGFHSRWPSGGSQMLCAPRSEEGKGEGRGMIVSSMQNMITSTPSNQQLGLRPQASWPQFNIPKATPFHHALLSSLRPT